MPKIFIAHHLSMTLWVNLMYSNIAIHLLLTKIKNLNKFVIVAQ